MAENVENVAVETQDQVDKTYTAAEVEELLQKETDRRVTSALKKQAEKQGAQLREAQKLANMDATQKYEYELSQREAAIAEKEKALALAENKNVASQILAEKGISLNLVDFIVDEDADVMNDRIKLLDREFKKSVKEEVEKRLASKVPTKSLPLDNAMTKEKFMKLSLREKQDLYDNNPEIYNQFK